MATLTREQVLEVLRRAGLYHLIQGHESELPEQIDTERDQALFDRLGIYRGEIVDSLGGSP